MIKITRLFMIVAIIVTSYVSQIGLVQAYDGEEFKKQLLIKKN